MSHTTDKWKDEEERGGLEGLHSAKTQQSAVLKQDRCATKDSCRSAHCAQGHRSNWEVVEQEQALINSHLLEGHPENWCIRLGAP